MVRFLTRRVRIPTAAHALVPSQVNMNAGQYFQRPYEDEMIHPVMGGNPLYDDDKHGAQGIYVSFG